MEIKEEFKDTVLLYHVSGKHPIRIRETGDSTFKIEITDKSKTIMCRPETRHEIEIKIKEK